jgi:Putative transposase/Transposase zinc-binding domain
VVCEAEVGGLITGKLTRMLYALKSFGMCIMKLNKKNNKLIQVFDTFSKQYLNQYIDNMPSTHKKAFKDISNCRTIKYGMIEMKCEDCEEVHYSFGACRNRACPKCNSLKNHEWIQNISNKFPNVNYYHIVFTVPDVLRYLARKNQRIFYSLLLSSVHDTLRAFSQSSEWINGKTGYMLVLHTWDSKLNIHPHVHVLFLGGYLNNKNEWTPLSASKVFPNEAMSCRFKTILLKSLRKHFQEKIPSELWKKKWIVYTKKAETGDSHVIEYLGAYVKKIAISSSRIVNVDESNVVFKYRHYNDRHDIKMIKMTVSGFEFIRRYMQHVLPNAFVRVRYYGLLHPSYSEEIKKIKNAEGNVTLSERHRPNETKASYRECSSCNKPFIMTMVIFPSYLVHRINNQDKNSSKFYNTIQMNTG